MKPIQQSLGTAAANFADRRKPGMGASLHRALRVVSRSQIARMAAALSYRTVFGLIPVLAIGVAILGGFATPSQMKSGIEDALSFTGLKEIVVQSPRPDGAGGPHGSPVIGPFGADDGVGEEATQTNPAKLEFWINNLVTKVREVSFLAIGITGSIMLIYAAMSFMVEIERSANHIYRAPTGRSWVRRITQYWTTLTLGSLFLIGTFWVSGQISNGLSAFIESTPKQSHVEQQAAASSGIDANQAQGQPAAAEDQSAKEAPKAPPSPTELVAMLAAKGVSAVTGFLLLLFLYMTIPNARVSLRCAAVGAAFASVLWEVGKSAFVAFIAFSSYQRLYGVLALIPLFLLWVYITWIIILFGLQLSYVLQHFRAFSISEEENRGPIFVDPLALLRVASIVATRFAGGATATVADVAGEAGLDEHTSLLMLDRLTEAGFLHHVPEGDETEAFALARPAEQIQAADLLRLATQLTDAKAERSDRLDAIRRAQYDAARGLSLAALLPDPAHAAEAGGPGEGPATRSAPDPVPAT